MSPLGTGAFELELRAARTAGRRAPAPPAPPLLASLICGLVVGVVQAATQIQDQTLTVLPKLAVVALTLVAMGPTLGAELVRFAQALLLVLPAFG